MACIIRDMCLLLRLPPQTMATSLRLYHRFMAAASTARPPIPEETVSMIEAACVLVACKTEETPRKIRDIVSTAVTLKRGTVLLITKEYWDSKANAIKCEQELLRCLSFDVSADPPPFTVVLHCVSSMLGTVSEDAGRLAQVAWSATSDAMLCPVYGKLPTMTIAVGSLAFASSLLRIDLQDPRSQKPWWESLGVPTSSVREVVDSLCTIYSRDSSPSRSPH